MVTFGLVLKWISGGLFWCGANWNESTRWYVHTYICTYVDAQHSNGPMWELHSWWVERREVLYIRESPLCLQLLHTWPEQTMHTLACIAYKCNKGSSRNPVAIALSACKWPCTGDIHWMWASGAALTRQDCDVDRVLSYISTVSCHCYFKLIQPFNKLRTTQEGSGGECERWIRGTCTQHH